ncbi:MAG TPA: hypothetical protein PK650_04125 [Candidatus Sumerlaeota bacterium]|nr:hypothetical protein [Candidatus Sumerlaeota bacterium]
MKIKLQKARLSFIAASRRLAFEDFIIVGFLAPIITHEIIGWYSVFPNVFALLSNLSLNVWFLVSIKSSAKYRTKTWAKQTIVIYFIVLNRTAKLLQSFFPSAHDVELPRQLLRR